MNFWKRLRRIGSVVFLVVVLITIALAQFDTPAGAGRDAGSRAERSSNNTGL